MQMDGRTKTKSFIPPPLAAGDNKYYLHAFCITPHTLIGDLMKSLLIRVNIKRF